MRDRSKNRKPLQKGRNLSSEAIQAIQALKRARRHGGEGELVAGGPLDVVIESKIRRLVKFDMMAVLGELQRQNEAFLSLQVAKISFPVSSALCMIRYSSIPRGVTLRCKGVIGQPCER